MLTFTVCQVLRSSEKQAHTAYYGNNCFHIFNTVHIIQCFVVCCFLTVATISVLVCYNLIIETLFGHLCSFPLSAFLFGSFSRTCALSTEIPFLRFCFISLMKEVGCFTRGRLQNLRTEPSSHEGFFIWEKGFFLILFFQGNRVLCQKQKLYSKSSSR